MKKKYLTRMITDDQYTVKDDEIVVTEDVLQECLVHLNDNGDMAKLNEENSSCSEDEETPVSVRSTTVRTRSGRQVKQANMSDYYYYHY